MQNTNNNWVYQSNKLIESSYTLTVLEQKLVRLLASMIKKDDDDFKEYEFKTKDLIKLLNTSKGRFYRDIDAVTDLLMQRIIKIRNKDADEFEKYHWVDVAKYSHGVLKLKINKELKPFYLSLDWYTKYQLKNIIQFKSTYSFRLYELLKQYENISYRILSINDLRLAFDIDKKQYPKYANLKQKVINVSINEINTYTDLHIEFQELKEVRKVTSIRFYISKKKVINEIAASSVDSKIDYINQVKSIIEEDISDTEAKKILDAAAGDLEKIKEKYAIISRLNKVNNVVGAMIQALKENWTTKGKTKINIYNNHKQKEYNIKEIERKLLGWD